MGFDWNEAAEGGAAADRVPAGINRLTIAKVLRGSKSRLFESKSGDPQLMIVLQDDQEREAALMVTLSKKAAWVLARLMSRFGVDLDELKAQNIEPRHFENVKVAEQWLLGRTGWARIEWEEADSGKVYANVEPLKEEEVPIKTRNQAKRETAGAGAAGFGNVRVDEEEIPF